MYSVQPIVKLSPRKIAFIIFEFLFVLSRIFQNVPFPFTYININKCNEQTMASWCRKTFSVIFLDKTNTQIYKYF